MPKKPAFLAGALLIVVLPLALFASAVAVALGSSLYLLNYSQSAQILKEKLERPLYSVFSTQPPVLGSSDAKINGADGRAALLTQYFAHHKAPLAPYGQKLIEEADKNGIDWKLLPAIAMQESNGGKKIPAGSNNAWGWGITASSSLGFESWEKGIETVARGLKTDYINRGLLTPEQIMSRYTPASLSKGGSWAKGVEYFIWELENF